MDIIKKIIERLEEAIKIILKELTPYGFIPEKKALTKEFKEKELKAFRESLPMKETDFPPLFDFLDNELSENDCQGDCSLLEKYCKEKNLDFITLTEWFKKYGGFCDCEILVNVEEQFHYLEKPDAENTTQESTNRTMAET